MNRNSSPRRIPFPTGLRAAAALTFVCLLGAAACASTRLYQAESLWPKNPILIDGKSDDWRGALAFVGEGELSLGFYNDGDSLYLCLLIPDEMTRRQIMRRGLTIWIDPQGGQAKTLGIRYPAGPPEGAFSGESSENPEDMGSTDGRRGRGWSRRGEQEEPPSEDALNDVAILRAGQKEPERVKLDQVPGFEAKLEEESGLLVYEAKIPLLGDGPSTVSVGAKPGTTIGVGFETPEFKRPGGGGPGGRGPGGMPGGGGFGGMGGRGRFGGRGMGNFDLPKPLKIWTSVKLASGAGPGPAAFSVSR
jgi:hypothetical protein